MNHPLYYQSTYQILKDLVPKLKYRSQSPRNNVIQCRANDVGKSLLERLLPIVHDIFSQCKIWFPKTKFACSSTLPRITWRYSTNTKAMNQSQTHHGNMLAEQLLFMKPCSLNNRWMYIHPLQIPCSRPWHLDTASTINV